MYEKLNKSNSSGSLDPKELKRLLVMSQNNQATQQSSLQKRRDGMGWPAKDITLNELMIEDQIIKGNVSTRFYRKKSLDGKKLPVLVYLHGGGFFGGSINIVEQICRTFADKEDILVVSVGYRLAPENPFPAGLLDCYSVVEYLGTTRNTDIASDQIFIAGDSAGGNLAITVSLLDSYHLQTHYIKKIVTFYPVTTLLTDGTGELWDSNKFLVLDDEERKLFHGYITGVGGRYMSMVQWYTQNKNLENPLISPLHATPEMLKALPPIKIITGEFDSLKLQAEALIDKFTSLNIDCQYSVHDGLLHGFMDKIGDYSQAEVAVQEAVDFFRQ